MIIHIPLALTELSILQNLLQHENRSGWHKFTQNLNTLVELFTNIVFSCIVVDECTECIYCFVSYFWNNIY